MSTLQDFWTKTQSTASAALSQVKSSFLARQGAQLDNGGSTDPYLNNRDYAVVVTQQQDLNGCKRPIVVVGSVPTDVQVDQNITWRAPWASGLSGNTGDLAAVATGNRLVAQVLTLQVWQASDEVAFTLTFDLRAYSSVERDVMQLVRNLWRMSVPSRNSVGFLIAPGPVLDADSMKELGFQIGTLGADVAASIGSGIANQFKNVTGTTVDGRSKLAGASESASATAKDVTKKVNASGLLRKEAIESKLKNVISLSIGNWFYMNNVVIQNVQHTMKAQQPGVGGGVMAASVTVTFKPMFTLTVDDIENLLKRAPA